jgi:hypothetical protein
MRDQGDAGTGDLTLSSAAFTLRIVPATSGNPPTDLSRSMRQVGSRSHAFANTWMRARSRPATLRASMSSTARAEVFYGSNLSVLGDALPSGHNQRVHRMTLGGGDADFNPGPVQDDRLHGLVD